MIRRQPAQPRRQRGITRRHALALGGAIAAGVGVSGGSWWWQRHERGQRAATFIAPAPDYDSDLAGVIGAALGELRVDRRLLRKKRVLLKPNLVETEPGQPQINTHPAVVTAAAEALRRLDAAEVLVAEGQGHRRDSRQVLDESGLGAALAAAGLKFVDLNHDEVGRVANAGARMGRAELYFPKSLLAADLVVSLPKLKTHHWAGMTCAMKNLFGVMPGIVYGWPKNVLHYCGIPNSICDINATVRPTLTIVDGIVGMEGDGPIMGTARELGALVVGRNLAATDATCARIIGFDPASIEYLQMASGWLGPIGAQNIEQRGEEIVRFATHFELPDFEHLRRIRRLGDVGQRL